MLLALRRHRHIVAARANGRLLLARGLSVLAILMAVATINAATMPRMALTTVSGSSVDPLWWDTHRMPIANDSRPQLAALQRTQNLFSVISTTPRNLKKLLNVRQPRP